VHCPKTRAVLKAERYVLKRCTVFTDEILLGLAKFPCLNLSIYRRGLLLHTSNGRRGLGSLGHRGTLLEIVHLS
jgi:hypothetical protein